MGEEGDKAGKDTAEAYDSALSDLQPLGEVSGRKMFGGYGIFKGGAMFSMVNSQGELFLKVDDTNRSLFEEAEAKQHGRMPYYQVPSDVLKDSDELVKWASLSVQVALETKKR